MITKRKLIDSAVSILSHSGVPVLARPHRRKAFCVFMLHGVTTDPNPDGIGNTEGIHIQEHDLEQICDLLARNYSVISLQRAVDHLRDGVPIPPRSVVLTFDDGYESNYTLAKPILERYELPATVFLATDFVHHRSWLWWDRLEYAIGHTTVEAVSMTNAGATIEYPLGTPEERRQFFKDLLPIVKGLPQEILHRQVGMLEETLETSLFHCPDPPEFYRPMTWDQAREMNAGGLITMGGHTHTHRILGRCSIPTARLELETCLNLLNAKLGIERPLFSYPNGHQGDHHSDTKKLVEELGFQCALLTEQGLNDSEADPFLLKRFSTGNRREYVDVVASGAFKWMLDVNHAVRRRLAA